MTELKKSIVADIEYKGKTIVLPGEPRKMEPREAGNYLLQIAEQEEKIVEFRRTYEGYEPHDTAVAFTRVMERTFGFVLSQTAVVNGMFGPMSIPPEVISFMIDVNESATIILGQFSLPGIKGHVNTSIEQERGANKPRFFVLSGEIQQKNRDFLDKLANEVLLEVKTNSIFKAKQFNFRLKDDDGDYLKIPKMSFIDLSNTTKPIFSDGVEEQLEISVYTPIKKTARWEAAGLPLKRGVLLFGPYGTGKTLTSREVARLCRENGWTFILCDRPDEFAEILRIARNWEPCVVFCEDIDQVVSGRRTVEMNDILNILDGVESKDSRIMTVVTTNEYENINKAMLRAGRLDARIFIPLPDEVAVGRLLRAYGGDMIAEDANLSEAATILAGNVTASEVAETITLAKSAAIFADDDLNGKITLTPKSLVYAARNVLEQSNRSKDKVDVVVSDVEKAADRLAAAIEASVVANTPVEVAN